MPKLKWWEDSVDEIIFGIAIAAIAIKMNNVAVATAAISVLGVYLGARSNKGNGGVNETTTDDDR